MERSFLARRPPTHNLGMGYDCCGAASGYCLDGQAGEPSRSHTRMYSARRDLARARAEVGEMMPSPARKLILGLFTPPPKAALARVEWCTSPMPKCTVPPAEGLDLLSSPRSIEWWGRNGGDAVIPLITVSKLGPTHSVLLENPQPAVTGKKLYTPPPGGQEAANPHHVITERRPKP